MLAVKEVQGIIDKYLWIAVLVLALVIFRKELLRWARRFVLRLSRRGGRQREQEGQDAPKE